MSFNSNSHFESCQVKVKAEVKENSSNFTYFCERTSVFEQLFFSSTLAST
jgi:hypothetical protein